MLLVASLGGRRLSEGVSEGEETAVVLLVIPEVALLHRRCRAPWRHLLHCYLPAGQRPEKGYLPCTTMADASTLQRRACSMYCHGARSCLVQDAPGPVTAKHWCLLHNSQPGQSTQDLFQGVDSIYQLLKWSFKDTHELLRACIGFTKERKDAAAVFLQDNTFARKQIERGSCMLTFQWCRVCSG